MGSSQSSATSASRKPNSRLRDIFIGKYSPPSQKAFFPDWLRSRSLGSDLSYYSHLVSVAQAPLEFEKIKRISRVNWCTSPFDEMGPLRNTSPRTLPRWLALRQTRGLAGPATWEGGHSYAIIEVEYVDAYSGSPPEPRKFRLNWGQGLKFGHNLTMTPISDIPAKQLTGDRLENSWEATCSPKELLQFLKRWDGREYDAAPSNNRNCHHFAQELIEQCTSERGYGIGDR
eukprot:TRINITY_DN105816_c0_g1_i1.p1 TRINITY_DN105816_c0_g1~~TRINITY_DN105816_c0_g1_i1.p1  ORF type:complete len:230 (-),score=14.92 TRINITY_DN105816_c0_g1_i1:70-759(-)